MIIHRHITAGELEQRLLDELRHARLPDAFLYLDHGAQAWLGLESDPEFPIAADLTELLRRHVCDLVGFLPTGLEVIAFGAGDARKEKLILDALPPVRFLAVDISRQMVARALATLECFPCARGLVAPIEDLPLLRGYWSPPALLCLLGNTFCNYHPDELLNTIAALLGPEDLFLFDAHLLGRDAADPALQSRTMAAYRSARNARFNLAPLLACGLHPHQCRFELDFIEEQTSAGPVLRTRKRIHILDHAAFALDGQAVRFQPGQTIAMGFTFLYTARQIAPLLAAAGLAPRYQAISPAGDGLLVLAGRNRKEGESP